MITKSKLTRIYYLSKELEMWKRRLEELEADIPPNSKPNDGMPHANTNAVKSPTEDKAILIADHYSIISGKAAELRIAIKEVETFIVNIEDPIVRQIIEYRCVKLNSWEDVADLMGRPYTAENVRQIYHRFVQNMEREVL